MTWRKWLEERRVEARATSRQEIDGIRESIARTLADAETGLALGAALGPDAGPLVDYLNRCRQKRNEVCYDWAGVSEGEARELLERARTLETTVETWITENHSALSRNS